jgi:hypothetical protein
MTMDDDGMVRRKTANIPPKELFRRLGPSDRERYFEPGSTESSARLKRTLSKEERNQLQRRVFLSLSYEERLEYCDRPEQVDGPSPESWEVINAHLGTKASALPELVTELGNRRFGRVPRVGDSFCGGGSIPFEAVRLGCEAYGSDLSPVAALLTWAAIHIASGSDNVTREVRQVQREILEAVDHQVTAWGIEHREPDPNTGRQWRADSYLYCTECKCPECEWRVLLAPSWVIAEKTGVIARLMPDERSKRFDIEIVEGASDAEMKSAVATGTVKDSELVCPKCKQSTPIRVIRGDGRGSFSDSNNLLRVWENRDLVPRPDDIFGERLYCIRWVDTWTELGPDGEPRQIKERHYLAPTDADLRREQQVLSLLLEHFDEWQRAGFIPSRKVQPGSETARLQRERGWTYWHHLFTPRQLLTNGLVSVHASGDGPIASATSILLVGKLADNNCRLSQWKVSQGGGAGGPVHAFANQALNTLLNYAARTVPTFETLLLKPRELYSASASSDVLACDGREVNFVGDLWITDPPYADAIEYAELSEFFLSWYEGPMARHFAEWYADSKRALAVRGSDKNFRHAMVECYRRIVARTPDRGLHLVMFTHQDAAVWADLALILWAAGLRVTAAWCIATETESALKQGNYVQGTVLLVLRKQLSEDTVFLDEVYPEVEAEVRRQIDSMKELDDTKEPNFGDTDYQLAAYAAALRVLTSKTLDPAELDVNYELTKTRGRDEKSPLQEVIERAVKIACDHLVPRGIDSHLWKSLSPLERLYLKGLEMESHGEYRSGVYQELARGFGVEEYKQLLASTKANQTRLKTASEFGRKEISDTGFGASLVRHALFGTFRTTETEGTREGLTWLKTEVPDYASARGRIIEILDFFAAFRANASMPHWHKDAEAALLLAGALRNRDDNV